MPDEVKILATMRRYQAQTADGRPICSVGASGIEIAKQQIIWQLRRPGRQPAYRQWEAGGFCIELIEEQ